MARSRTSKADYIGIGVMKNKMESTTMAYIGVTGYIYLGYIGEMEKKMETAMVYWVYIGMMEKKMETTIYGLGVQTLSSQSLTQ